jgi:hypothetical protein
MPAAPAASGPDALAASLLAGLLRRVLGVAGPLHFRGSGPTGPQHERSLLLPTGSGGSGAPPPPSPRTKWARRVPHPVPIGHAASLTPYFGGRISRRRRQWRRWGQWRRRRLGQGARGGRGRAGHGGPPPGREGAVGAASGPPQDEVPRAPPPPRPPRRAPRRADVARLRRPRAGPCKVALPPDSNGSNAPGGVDVMVCCNALLRPVRPCSARAPPSLARHVGAVALLIEQECAARPARVRPCSPRSPHARAGPPAGAL